MSEITKTDEPTTAAIPSTIWAGMAVFVVVSYFIGLTIPLLGPDEPRYAQVAREMFERSDWVTPTLGGFHWFEKPVLLYWLEMVSYRIFGIGEFAARFGSALFGLGTVASLYVLGRFIDSPARQPAENGVAARTDFANWLAVIAASTLGVIVFARGASFDIIVTFPITAALVSFYLFDHARSDSFKAKHLPLILFYVFIGFALLAKGLIGIVFPFAIVAFYYILSRRLPGRTFVLSLVWGTLAAAAVAATWYLPMYQRHGYEFIDEFFIQHHFQRFTSNKYQHPQPFIFFFWVLPLMTLPWLPFFFGAVWKVVKGLFQLTGADSRQPDRSLPFSSTGIIPFAIAWMLVPLLFFSLSGSKLPGYILPSVPAAIVLTALFAYALVRRSSGWRNVVLVVAPGTLAVCLLLLVFVVPRFAAMDSVKSLIQAADDRGYVSNPVLTLHMISHNAEFYAAGRLLRDETGKQRRLINVAEVRAEIAENGGSPVLVLIPLEHLSHLTRDETVRTEVLRDNSELAIAVVSSK